MAARGGAAAVVWSVGLAKRWSGAVGLARWGWRARGWCRRGCWNGEGGGAVAGGAGLVARGGWLAGVEVTERENVKVRERKVENEREREKMGK
jgi:hypothetical protein